LRKWRTSSSSVRLKGEPGEREGRSRPRRPAVLISKGVLGMGVLVDPAGGRKNRGIVDGGWSGRHDFRRQAATALAGEEFAGAHG
jgi:hypothetical protein